VLNVAIRINCDEHASDSGVNEVPFITIAKHVNNGHLVQMHKIDQVVGGALNERVEAHQSLR
jgi:hypothetical protein